MSDIKVAVQTWAKRIGYEKALSRLIASGVSTRAAERLCAGEYQSEPKAIRSKLLEELAKDGIVLTDEAS